MASIPSPVTVQAARAQPGPARRSLGDLSLGYLMLAPALIAVAAVALYPVVDDIWQSMHARVLIDPTQHGFVGLQYYKTILSDTRFQGDLLQTFGFMAVSVTIEFVLGLALALIVNETFRGRAVVRTAILLPWAVPTVVSAMLWKTMFDQRTGFIDFTLGALHLPGAQQVWFNSPHLAWVPIIVADVWKNTPFVALLLLAGLQVIPSDLYEAARIDGASAFRRMWSVTIPLLRPALLVALIFRSLSAFLVFDVVYAMTGGGPGTSTEVVSYLNWYYYLTSLDFGMGSAVSVILVAITLIIAAVYVRVIRFGTEGAR